MTNKYMKKPADIIAAHIASKLPVYDVCLIQVAVLLLHPD